MIIMQGCRGALPRIAVVGVVGLCLLASISRAQEDPDCDPYWDMDCEVGGITVKRDQPAEQPAATVEKVESVPDTYRYPPYRGPKQTIAVLAFENKARNVPESLRVGEGLTEMLISELIKTDRFILVERTAIREILGEQELGQTGLVRSESAAAVGGLAGAQFLVKGAVTEFEYQAEGSGFAMQFSGLDLGTESKKAHVAIDVRLIDSNTGQIITSHRAKARADASKFNIGFAEKDFRIGTAQFEQTPLGVATRAAMRDAVQFIIREGQGVGWSGSIIKVVGNTAYINRGANAGISRGQNLRVFSRGEVLIDPDTGLNLGSEEMFIGTLVIDNVQSKFASGQLRLFGVLRPKRGDTVRLE